jgi:hypothetical protein
MGKRSKSVFIFLIFLTMGCRAPKSEPAPSPSPSPVGLKAPASQALPYVRIEELPVSPPVADVAANPTIREEGLVAFSSRLSNPGEVPLKVWLQVPRSDLQLNTRIHEKGSEAQIGPPIRPDFYRISHAKLRVRRVKINRKNARTEAADLDEKQWVSFSLAAHEEVTLSWLGLSENAILCPFWFHRNYGGCTNCGRYHIDWSFDWASLTGSADRRIQVTGEEVTNPMELDQLDEPRAARKWQNWEDQRPDFRIPPTQDAHSEDEPMSCSSGLFQILPSSP